MNNQKETQSPKKVSHLHNSFFSLLSWIIPMVVTFLATPHIVSGLGNEQYGLYALITGFIAYSFSFNVGRAVTKYVAEFSAKDETEKISQIISATFFLTLTVSVIGALILAALTNFLVTDFFQINPGAREETAVGFYLAGLCIVLLGTGQVFSATIQAMQRFDVFSFIATFANVSLVLGNLVLVLLGFKFAYLILWNAVTMLLSGLAYFISARKLQPETKINFNFSRKMLFLTARYSSNIIAYQIFANITLLWERSVITKIRGVEDLTHYVVPMTMAAYLHTFIGSITSNFLALASDMFAQSKTDQLELLYRRGTKIVLLMVVFICISLSVGARTILTNWIDSQFAEAAYQAFIFLMIFYSALASIVVAWQFIEGFGYPSYNMILSFFLILISAPLMVILTRNFGIEGTGAARIIGVMPVPIYVALIERKIFGRVLWDLWGRIFLLLTIAGFIAGSVEYFILSSLSGNWVSVITAIGISGLIYLVIIWFLYYFTQEDKDWINSKLIQRLR